MGVFELSRHDIGVLGPGRSRPSVQHGKWGSRLESSDRGEMFVLRPQRFGPLLKIPGPCPSIRADIDVGIRIMDLGLPALILRGHERQRGEMCRIRRDAPLQAGAGQHQHHSCLTTHEGHLIHGEHMSQAVVYLIWENVDRRILPNLQSMNAGRTLCNRTGQFSRGLGQKQLPESSEEDSPQWAPRNAEARVISGISLCEPPRPRR